MRDIKWNVYMCVNIKLKTAYKNNNTFLKLHTMTIGQHFLAILGALAVDKRRKEWLLNICIAFLLLDC